MKSTAHKLATLRSVFDMPCQVSLHTGDPEQGNEVSYPNYARVQTMFAINENAASNVERIIFAECENADVLVTHVGIHQDGQLMHHDQLPAPVRVSHLIRPEIPAGAITVIET
jgi:hypothetical protein